MKRLTILVATALLAAASGCAPVPDGAAASADASGGVWRQQDAMISMTDAEGAQHLLAGRVCRPLGDGPSRVVVIAHGSPPIAARRATMTLTSCDAEAPRWFLEHGYVVAMALRRGYGATGGAYAEAAVPCTEQNYVRAAQQSALDVAAVVRYAAALPYARPDKVVVVGQSAGGWAALGLESLPHASVSAIVSMAGGRGGHVGNRANDNCGAPALAAAAGQLGRTAATPMLWIYTENDSYFAPFLAKSMHDAFTAAGGQAEFHQLGPFGRDGHGLFFGRGGSAVWGPLIDAYLRRTS